MNWQNYDYYTEIIPGTTMEIYPNFHRIRWLPRWVNNIRLRRYARKHPEEHPLFGGLFRSNPNVGRVAKAATTEDFENLDWGSKI